MGEFGSKLGALVADVGDRDDLPEGGAGERTDGKKPPRRNAVAVDDRAIRAGLDTDMQRIDPRQAPVEQAAHSRIGRGEGIFDDPGAIDDGADLGLALENASNAQKELTNKSITEIREALAR